MYYIDSYKASTFEKFIFHEFFFSDLVGAEGTYMGVTNLCQENPKKIIDETLP